MWHQFAFFGESEGSTITTAGLVSWLQGGTGSYNPSTNIWLDASGNGNSGSVINGPLTISSTISNAWQFPTTGGYGTIVEWPSILNSEPTGAFTVVVSGNFQIPVSGSSFTLPLFTKYNGGGWADTQEVYNPSTNPNPKGRANQFYIYGGTSGNNRIDYVASGNKQVLTFMSTPSGVDSGKWQLYVNKVSSGPFGGAVRKFNFTGAPLRFGADRNQPSETLKFTKSVSDLLVYDRILTLDEIFNNVDYLLSYNPNT